MRREDTAASSPPALRALQTYLSLAEATNRDFRLSTESGPGAAILARLAPAEREAAQRWLDAPAGRRRGPVSQQMLDEIGKIVADAKLRGVLGENDPVPHGRRPAPRSADS